jgi:hypothetical protein
MSLAVTVYIPTGIVMAADSRTILTMRDQQDDSTMMVRQKVLSDATYKLALLEAAKVGISTVGDAHIDDLPIDSHLNVFEEEAIEPEDTVSTIAPKLGQYFRDKFSGAEVGFYVAGYEKRDRASIPHVYFVHTKAKKLVNRKNINSETGDVVYGVAWAGYREVVDLLFQGTPMIPYQFLNLQDAIDLAAFLLDTTAKTLRFRRQIETVGGPIDILMITPSEARFVQRKELGGF